MFFKRNVPCFCVADFIRIRLILAGILAIGAMPVSTMAEVSSIWGDNGSSWNKDRLPDFSYAGYHAGQKSLPNVTVKRVISPVAGDNTSHIQQAIDSVSNGAVLLKSGNYVINGMLKLRKSHVVLRGEGSTTVLNFKRHLTDLTSGNQRLWATGPGGLIWVGQNPGNVSEIAVGDALTTVTQSASRLGQVLTVASTAGIRAGDYVVLKITDDQARSWGRHLHADLHQPGTQSWQPMNFHWPVKISSVSGNRLLLAQPLRFDIRMSWSPTIHRYSPLQEIGIENMHIAMPAIRAENHLQEPGYNGIFFEGVLNSWVRNVSFVNTDNVITVGRASKHNTLRNITVFKRQHDSWKTGHHGISFNVNAHDNLLTDFDIKGIHQHDITITHQSSGNVVRNGKGVRLSLDFHRNQPFANLLSNLHLGNSKIGNDGDSMYLSSGAANAGPHSGARTVFWNIRSNSWRYPELPSWNGENAWDNTDDFPRSVIIPASVNVIDEHNWAERISNIEPQDLYASQLSRRLNDNSGGNEFPPQGEGGKDAGTTDEVHRASTENCSNSERVIIVDNNVRTASGEPLRGEHLAITTWNQHRINSDEFYRDMKEKYKLNTIRLMAYIEYQAIPSYVCDPETQCLTAQEILPLMRTAVDKAKQHGLYAIIDLHGLHITYDHKRAKDWWSVIAPEFKDEKHVLYQAANEPLSFKNRDVQDVGTYKLQMMEELYHHIRALAPDTHIINWSINGYTENSGLMSDLIRAAERNNTPNIDYSNASVAFHAYGYTRHGMLHDFSNATELRRHYPIIMTEMQRSPVTDNGCNNRNHGTGDYNTDVQRMEKLGMSWITLKGYPLADNCYNYFDIGPAPLQVTWEPQDGTQGCDVSNAGGSGSTGGENSDNPGGNHEGSGHTGFPSGRLIENGGFRGNLEPWALVTAGGSRLVLSNSESGTQDVATVVLDGKGEHADLAQDGISLQADRQYRMTLDIKGLNLDVVTLHMHENNANGQSLGLHNHGLPVSNVWQPHEVLFTAGKSTNNAMFFIRMENSARGQLHVDNVELELVGEEDSGGDDPDDGGNTGGSGGTPVDHGMVRNSGFEQGKSHWHYWSDNGGSFRIMRASGSADKVAVVNLENIGTSENTQIYQKNMRFKPNTTYRLTFQAMATVDNREVRIKLLKHKSPFTGYSQTEKVYLTKGWKQYTVVLRTNGKVPDTADGRLRFVFRPVHKNPNLPDYTAYFNNISMKEMP